MLRDAVPLSKGFCRPGWDSRRDVFFSQDTAPGATSPRVAITCCCGQAKFLLANVGSSPLSPHLDKLY